MKNQTPVSPVQPGHIRLVHLQQEGRLQKGDTVETARLGKCKVAYIQSSDSICVTSADGKYFTLSGFGFNARMVSAASAAQAA